METNQEPFVIYGDSGCGKTAVLAKLADQVNRSHFYLCYYLWNVLIFFNFL